MRKNSFCISYNEFEKLKNQNINFIDAKHFNGALCEQVIRKK